MHDLSGPQKFDGVIYIRVIGQPQDVVVGDTSFLFRCKIFRQICDNIAFDADTGSVPGSTGGGSGIDACGMVHKVAVKARRADLIIGEVPGQLVDDGTNHLKMSQFLGTDVRQQPLQLRIGHRVALTQISQRCTQFSVRSTVLQ